MSSEFTTPSPSKIIFFLYRDYDFHYVQRVDAGFETFKYTFCRLFIDYTKDLHGSRPFPFIKMCTVMITFMKGDD